MSQQLCQICKCGNESCKGCTKQEQCQGCNSVGSCCCANTHVLWHKEQVRKGVFLEYFSLGWMSVEVIASIIAGLIVGKSFALLAFGGDSIVELISAYVVLDYLKKLREGIFQSEAYSKETEKLATSLLILLIPVIAGGAIYSYFSGIKPEASPLGIAVAVGAVIAMPILWIQKKRIGRDGNILVLRVDAAESATCFFMSTALLAGLLLDYFFQITWADYVATAIILGFVGLEIRESLEEMRE